MVQFSPHLAYFLSVPVTAIYQLRYPWSTSTTLHRFHHSCLWWDLLLVELKTQDNKNLLFPQAIITVALLFIKNVYSLINYVSYVEALFILLSVAGLLILRRKQPDLNRPIKVNTSLPVIYLITASFLVISSIYQSPWETGIGTLVILLGIPVYYATIHHPQKWLTQTSQRINGFCQKLFLCVPNQEKID